MAFETALENMRYGYACSELLRRSRIHGVYPHLELQPPSRADLRFIWRICFSGLARPEMAAPVSAAQQHVRQRCRLVDRTREARQAGRPR